MISMTQVMFGSITAVFSLIVVFFVVLRALEAFRDAYEDYRSHDYIDARTVAEVFAALLLCTYATYGILEFWTPLIFINAGSNP